MSTFFPTLLELEEGTYLHRLLLHPYLPNYQTWTTRLGWYSSLVFFYILIYPCLLKRELRLCMHVGLVLAGSMETFTILVDWLTQQASSFWYFESSISFCTFIWSRSRASLPFLAHPSFWEAVTIALKPSLHFSSGSEALSGFAELYDRRTGDRRIARIR